MAGRAITRNRKFCVTLGAAGPIRHEHRRTLLLVDE